MNDVHSPSLDSVEAGEPANEIEINPEMIEAGAEVFCRCFEDLIGQHNCRLGLFLKLLDQVFLA